MKNLIRKILKLLFSEKKYNRLTINFLQLTYFIKNPHNYFIATCNIQLLRNIYLTIFLFFQKKIFYRKENKFFKSHLYKNDTNTLEEKGYLIYDVSSNPFIKKILSESNKIIDDLNLEDITWVSGDKYIKGVRNNKTSKSWKNPNKPQLNRNLFYDSMSKIDFESPFIQFALDEKLLNIIANYFGEIPRLDYAGIWMSKNPWEDKNNKKGYNLSSQQFHTDGEAHKTIKLFLFLNEWTESNGPLCFYDKKKSKKIQNNLGIREQIYNKDIYCDENIHRINNKNGFHILTGKPGKTVLLDTCSCYHYGSRINNDEKRFVFTLQYLPKHAIVKTHDFSHLINPSLSKLQKLCLSS
jgi:hypothetical protein